MRNKFTADIYNYVTYEHNGMKFRIPTFSEAGIDAIEPRTQHKEFELEVVTSGKFNHQKPLDGVKHRPNHTHSIDGMCR